MPGGGYFQRLTDQVGGEFCVSARRACDGDGVVHAAQGAVSGRHLWAAVEYLLRTLAVPLGSGEVARVEVGVAGVVLHLRLAERYERTPSSETLVIRGRAAYRVHGPGDGVIHAAAVSELAAGTRLAHAGEPGGLGA